MGGQPITLTGRSGSTYPFTLHALGTHFDPVGGVYVAVSRQSPVALAFPRTNSLGAGLAAQYIGQSSDLGRRPEHHHREACFDRVGVIRIAILVEPDEQRRRLIEADLVAGLQPPLNRTDLG